MTVQGNLLERLKRESLILLVFLGCKDISGEMLGIANRTLRMKTTQRREEPRDGKKSFAGNRFF